MKQITRYHIRRPGELWVCFTGGITRRATVREEINFLGWVPDMALLIGWHVPPQK